MAVFDLTHPLENGMPVFPGEPGPDLRNTASISGEGYRVKWLGMGSHTGTHVDAPAHLIPGGKTLDRFPVAYFAGAAAILQIPPGTTDIGVPLLESHRESILASEFVLLRTGWYRYWGTDGYFSGFPVLSPEAARWLTGMPLRGIGLDTISADPADSLSLPVHHILLEAGWIIVENLSFPEECKATEGMFIAFPLKIADADGSPVRAVLMTDDVLSEI